MPLKVVYCGSASGAGTSSRLTRRWEPETESSEGTARVGTVRSERSDHTSTEGFMLADRKELVNKREQRDIVRWRKSKSRSEDGTSGGTSRVDELTNTRRAAPKSIKTECSSRASSEQAQVLMLREVVQRQEKLNSTEADEAAGAPLEP